MASVTWIVVALLIIFDGVHLVVGCNYGFSTACPGESCLDIYRKNPNSHGVSGQYVVKIGNQHHFVYCDMVLECGGEKGWMRIGHVSYGGSCPNGWSRITSPVRACRAPSNSAGCHSAHFSTHNIPYGRVCGMVIGYQKGTPDAFHSGASTINNAYLDGVSITYGATRKHLWSYGAGVSEKYANRPATCPCELYGGTPAPTFVQNHYYCEAGTTSNKVYLHRYYNWDPLWDGEGCSLHSSCCAQPGLPWFYRQLPVASNENLEARICYDQSFWDEAVLVKEIQLYVQ